MIAHLWVAANLPFAIGNGCKRKRVEINTRPNRPLARGMRRIYLSQSVMGAYKYRHTRLARYARNPPSPVSERATRCDSLTL